MDYNERECVEGDETLEIKAANWDLNVKKQDKVLKNRIKECFSDFWSGILFKHTAIRIGIFDDITIFNVCLLSHHWEDGQANYEVEDDIFSA